MSDDVNGSRKTRSKTYRSTQGRQNRSGNFWAFDSYLTPTLIQIFFWLGAFVFVVLGVFQMSTGGVGVLLGLLTLLLGPLLVRVNCECLIVFFRMSSTLTEIKDKLEHAKTKGKSE